MRIPRPIVPVSAALLAVGLSSCGFALVVEEPVASGPTTTVTIPRAPAGAGAAGPQEVTTTTEPESIFGTSTTELIPTPPPTTTTTTEPPFIPPSWCTSYEGFVNGGLLLAKAGSLEAMATSAKTMSEALDDFDRSGDAQLERLAREVAVVIDEVRVSVATASDLATAFNDLRQVVDEHGEQLVDFFARGGTLCRGRPGDPDFSLIEV